MKISNLAMELFPVNQFSTGASKKPQSFGDFFRGELVSNPDTPITEVSIKPFFDGESLTEEEILLITKLFESLKFEEISEENVAMLLVQLLNQLFDKHPTLEKFADIEGNTLTDHSFKVVSELLESYSKYDSDLQDKLLYDSGLQDNNQLLPMDKEFIETILPIVTKLKEQITKPEPSLEKKAVIQHFNNGERQLFVEKNNLLEPKERVNTIFLGDNLLFYRKPTKLPTQEIKDISIEGDSESIINQNQGGIFAFQNSNGIQTGLINSNYETNIANILKTVNLELKEKMVILKEGETTTSKLKLYPEELGEVNVLLKLNQGQLTIRIIAGSEQAFNHLNDQGKELQQRFENGSFSEVNVEFLMDSGNSDKEKENHANFEKRVKLSDKESEEEVEYKDLIRTTYNYKV